MLMYVASIWTRVHLKRWNRRLSMARVALINGSLRTEVAIVEGDILPELTVGTLAPSTVDLRFSSLQDR